MMVAVFLAAWDQCPVIVAPRAQLITFTLVISLYVKLSKRTIRDPTLDVTNITMI